MPVADPLVPISDETDAFAESFVLDHVAEGQLEDDKIQDVLNVIPTDKAYILSRSDRPINEYTTKLLFYVFP